MNGPNGASWTKNTLAISGLIIVSAAWISTYAVNSYKISELMDHRVRLEVKLDKVLEEQAEIKNQLVVLESQINKLESDLKKK